MNYHPALLALLPVLFLYQFSSYFMKAGNIAARKRQRLAMMLEFSDGVLTGVLVAFVGFEPIVVISLGMAFLITIISAMKPTAPLDLLGLLIGAVLTEWLNPMAVTLGAFVQLMILAVAMGYALLLVNMARHAYFKLAEQYGSVRRQNESLTLRTFRLSKYLSPPLRKAILTGKNVRAETQEKL
jgi:hypothetical protein